MQWQPIDSAPKLEAILLWWPTECGRAVVGRWCEHKGGHWYSDVTDCFPDQSAGPTHWMPLPDPPKGEE